MPCKTCEHLKLCQQIVITKGRVMCEIPDNGRPATRTCLDCPKPISRGATRCRACAAVHRYKDVVKPPVSTTCVSCGTPIKGFGLRCKSCASTVAYRERMESA